MARYPLPVKKGPVKKEDKKAAPSLTEFKIPETITTEKALAMATSWNNANNIGNKLSVGTLTTAKYQERVSVFDQMNQKVKDQSALFPQQSYFGVTPDPTKDPYNRRKVK